MWIFVFVIGRGLRLCVQCLGQRVCDGCVRALEGSMQPPADSEGLTCNRMNGYCGEQHLITQKHQQAPEGGRHVRTPTSTDGVWFLPGNTNALLFLFLISVIIIFFPFSQRAGYNFTFLFLFFFNRAEQEPSPPLLWEFVETVLWLEECKWLREVDGRLERQLARCRTLWKPKKRSICFCFLLLAWQEVVKE